MHVAKFHMFALLLTENFNLKYDDIALRETLRKTYCLKSHQRRFIFAVLVFSQLYFSAMQSDDVFYTPCLVVYSTDIHFAADDHSSDSGGKK